MRRFPELEQDTHTGSRLRRQPRMIHPKPQRRPETSPRRKSMSIAIGYAYDQGVVFCADTKISTDIKTNESKIAFYASDDGQACLTFAMAGNDMDYARSSAAACWEMVQKLDFKTATLEIVQQAVQFALGDFYESKILDHPDRLSGALDYKLLVGIWLRGETRLYINREVLLTPVQDYECIGTGSYLANYLIRQYRQANPGTATLADATLIASLAVEAAIEHDPHCGGESEILVVRNDGDMSNAYPTAAYPGPMVGGLQKETWKLLHDLAHADLKAAAAAKLEEYFERVRKLNDFYGYVFEMGKPPRG